MKPALSLIALCTASAMLAEPASAAQGLAVATLSLPDAVPYETALASTAPAPAAPQQVAQIAVAPTAAARPAVLAQAQPAPVPAPARPEPGAMAEPAPRPLPPPPPPGHPPHPPGPMEVAGLLAAQEIALGIRSDQIDVWRAYASAVVDLVKAMAPPMPPAPPKKDEPFGLSQAIATRAAEAGAKAKAVLDARTVLLAKLTPAQTELARTLDVPPPPPPPPHGGAMPPAPPPPPGGMPVAPRP